jgi:hypothetical protein
VSDTLKWWRVQAAYTTGRSAVVCGLRIEAATAKEAEELARTQIMRGKKVAHFEGAHATPDDLRASRKAA